MPIAPTAALLALALLGAGEDEVGAHAALHGRFTDRENTPDPTVLYDRAARTFDLAPYLRTTGSDQYPSTLVSAGLDGRHGALRWALMLDTGELRSQQFPRTSAVCATSQTPTGIDVLARGDCDLTFSGARLRRGQAPPTVALPDTRLQPAQLTSNGRAFEDELSSTLLVREAWAGAVFGRNDFAGVKVGRMRFTVADGFVYDDYGTGVEASLDLGALGPSFDVGAAIFYPTRDFPRAAGITSPMVALRADWLPSLFGHVGLFLALYRDREDSTAELFRGALAEPSVVRLQGTGVGTAAYQKEARTLAQVLGAPLHSGGTLGWLGTSGSLGAGPLKLDWTGALGGGTLTLATQQQQVESRIHGQLAWARLRRGVLDDVELYGFFLFLSGDLPPTEKQRLGLPPRYGGFIGISPYVTATNIFFQGGVAETFASRQATAPGVNGRGVIAPGLGATWEPARALALDARAAWLAADEQGPYGGSFYGTETDFQVAWSPWHGVTLVAEADALFGGDFFAGGAPITKVVVGFDLEAP